MTCEHKNTAAESNVKTDLHPCDCIEYKSMRMTTLGNDRTIMVYTYNWDKVQEKIAAHRKGIRKLVGHPGTLEF